MFTQSKVDATSEQGKTVTPVVAWNDVILIMASSILVLWQAAHQGVLLVTIMAQKGVSEADTST